MAPANVPPPAPGLAQSGSKALQLMFLASFLVGWEISWYNIIRLTMEMIKGIMGSKTHIEDRAEWCVLVAGLVMTNVLGYMDFRRQGRLMEARLAALDLDVPYTEPCPDYASLQLRQGIWRSVPLAVCSLYVASRAFVEMPICQIAATMGESRIGSGNATVLGPSYDIIGRDWDKTHSSLRLEDIKIRSKFVTLEDLAVGLHWKEKEFETYAWQACQCDKSHWTLENVPGREAIFSLRFTEPQDSFGPLAGGRLHAASVLFGQKVLHILKEQGETFERVLVPLFASLSGYSYEEFLFQERLASAAAKVGFDRIVELLLEQVGKNQVEEDNKYQHDKFPVQHRQAKMELLLAGFLLSVSLNPLLKAIFTARSVTLTSHKLFLALHGLLDILVLVFAILVASITMPAWRLAHTLDVSFAIAEKEFSKPAIQGATRALVGISDWCQNTRKTKCFKHFKEHWNHMPDWLRDDVYNSISDDHFVRDTGAALTEVSQIMFSQAKSIVDAFSVSNENLVSFGIAVVAFLLGSAFLANTMLPGVRLQKTALLNVGFAGPFHLAACVPEADVKKVLDRLLLLVGLRGLILTLSMTPFFVLVDEEPFLTLCSNRRIRRGSLVPLWILLVVPQLGLGSGQLGIRPRHFVSAYFCVNALRDAYKLVLKDHDVEKAQTAQIQYDVDVGKEPLMPGAAV
eukprot:Skav231492  [mRNA]  locus=scaffold354:8537:12133:- [translate_table: standard]